MYGDPVYRCRLIYLRALQFSRHTLKLWCHSRMRQSGAMRHELTHRLSVMPCQINPSHCQLLVEVRLPISDILIELIDEQHLLSIVGRLHSRCHNRWCGPVDILALFCYNSFCCEYTDIFPFSSFIIYKSQLLS